ncbi:MAG: hypothetical protein HQL30_00020 [Candidatus Omnitrophica bacterium]|nr:hypothetical protein [Candidatus Omnitrophota bacterium]
MVKTFVERRKFKRIKGPSLLSYRLIAGRGKASEWNMAAIVDMGAGGALFYSNTDLGVNTELEVMMVIGETKKRIISGAKVLRIMEIKKPSMFLTAVLFHRINEKSRKEINGIVEKESGKRSVPGPLRSGKKRNP